MKYSVIIPLYKAEKTIRRCLDSILSQPHDNVEILLINDGSPDGSGEICREYEKNHTCICYIEKENEGVSSARNCGLDFAKGDYILFVDSDDFVMQNFFSAIDEELSVFDYDLIQFSNYFTDGKSQTERIREPFRATTREALFLKLVETFYRKKSNGPVAKVFRRSLIEDNGIRFPEDMEVGEDRAFYMHYSMYMNSFCVSNQPIYVVSLENRQSLSRKYRENLDEQTIHLNAYVEAAMRHSDVVEEERVEYQKTLNYDRLRMIYSKAKMLYRQQTPFIRRFKAIKGYCSDLNQMQLEYPDSIYCRVTSFPIRRNLVLVIDAMAWKLTH